MTAATLEERAKAVARLAELVPYHWPSHARPDQLAPSGDWLVWLILAGRGWGKTRTGAEWVKAQALANPQSRWAVVAPTYADGRDTCIEGDSGILSILPKDRIRTWNRSLGELVLRNGARIKIFSADEPERLRGPQHHGAWCDEPASWRHGIAAWDQLQFGLRLGQHPRTVVTGTPKPVALVKQLVKRDTGVVVTRGSTFDNAANLAPAMLAELQARYEGTRLGRQELYAELLEDTPGALWTMAMIDPHRVATIDDVPDLVEVVVAVDPAVTSGEESDETGIVVAGRDHAGHGWVLEDLSGRYTPEQAMSITIDAYHALDADAVVIERNNGGDYLPAMLRSLDRSVRVETVAATRGKAVRAQPVSALYEQGRVHHVGGLPTLEDQLVSWTPDDIRAKSPDRLDALVWAFHRLLLRPQSKVGRIVAYGEAA